MLAPETICKTAYLIKEITLVKEKGINDERDQITLIASMAMTFVNDATQQFYEKLKFNCNFDE